MDRILPPNTLAYFPVQYFSQREASQAATLRTTRSSGASIVNFGDSFGGARASLSDTTPHRAIDIMAPRGLPVFAAISGVVPATWTVYHETTPGVRVPVQIRGIGTPTNPPNGDGGNYVVLVDDAGRHNYYAHLNEAPLVFVGQRVQAGQLIGYVGNTGRRARHTDPHLHYQITTRPGTSGHSSLTFWNPFADLARLATALGANRRGRQIELTFDAFLGAVQGRRPTGLVDPWTGSTTSEVIDPWVDAY